MDESSVVPLRQPEEIVDPLTEVLRSGARRLIAQAVEAEFEAFLSEHADLCLPDGRRRVVRRDHAPARTIQTGSDGRLEDLAAPERTKPVAEGRARRHLPRRRRSRNPAPVRRLIPAVTHNPA
jgi:hypothetical protein